MFQKKESYNPFVQIDAMKVRFPQFTAKRQGFADIIFTGDLLVRAGFPVYTVWIHYQGDLRPIVKILKPALVENPPHFFKSSNSLCLYKSTNYTWSKRKLIATDILPWTAAWIFFYEVWLQTGIWYGPEAAHDIDESK